MEELIWKYIDEVCSEDEIKRVENLLKTDPDFLDLYQHSSLINVAMQQSAEVKISDNFKYLMIANIEKAVAIKSVAVEPIMPTYFTVLLALVGAASIIGAIYLPTSIGMIDSIELPIDERTLTYTTWSLIAFVGLSFVDYSISKLKVGKSRSFMMV